MQVQNNCFQCAILPGSTRLGQRELLRRHSHNAGSAAGRGAAERYIRPDSQCKGVCAGLLVIYRCSSSSTSICGMIHTHICTALVARDATVLKER